MPGLVRWLLSAEAALRRLACRKRLAILTVMGISLGGRALLLPVLAPPKPAIQDEFSYLLAADTFEHGRLANPPHPMRAHFETPQVLTEPTYASKYPPFSALLMAFGQRVFGHPWVGVWLSAGLLCGALCWALQGWLPPYWAFIGALLAVARIGVVSYWTESYWGGTCASIGGALLFGALGRIRRAAPLGRTGPPGPALLAKDQASPAAGCGPGGPPYYVGQVSNLRAAFQAALPKFSLPFAIGLAILANTRPFEGFLLALLCAITLALTIPLRRLPRVTAPTALLLLPVLAWMAYYNFRVTGNALELPYRAHENQYAIWLPFLWQTHSSPEPHYNNDFLRTFWVAGDGSFKQYERDHILKVHVYDFFQLEQFYLGGPLFLCICFCLWALIRNRKSRLGLILLASFAALTAVECRMVPHYAAPATALIFGVAAASLRIVRRTWPGRRTEALYVTWAVLALFAVETGWRLSTPSGRYFTSGPDYHRAAKRERALTQISSEPGKQLVLVRYGPKHDLFEELVYNLADIDDARVVWARSLGPELDRALLRYYQDRKIWLVEENGDLQVTPYPVDQYYTSQGGRSNGQVL